MRVLHEVHRTRVGGDCGGGHGVSPRERPVNRPTVVARRPGVDTRTGHGQAFGTFGELLQGRLPGGDDFLVTLPITLRSTAWFRLDPAGPLRVSPSHKLKSLALAA